MNRKVLATIQSCFMLAPGDAVVVGVSGGADSMALLHVLLNLPLGLCVTAAHLNHGIRGGEADRDEACVAAFCREHGVSLEIRRADVPALAKQSGQSLEEAGRNARYAFFTELASGRAARIATGHTKSDSVETTLFHLMRGAGLAGVCGIPPVRGRIIRPLIECDREETERYCREHSISFVQDSTNFTPSHTRNRIRRELLPLMEDICPGAAGSLWRFSELARMDNALLHAQAARAAADCDFDGQSLCADHLRAQEDSIVLRVLRLLYQTVSGNALNAFHAKEVLQLLRSGRQTGRVQLPKGGYVRLSQGRLILSKDALPMPVKAKKGPLPLSPGENGAIVFENMRISLDLLSRGEYDIIHNLVKHSAFDYDKIKHGLYVRSRRDGDRFWPGHGTASLKKRLVNAKHPRETRDAIPLICDGDSVVCAIGYGVDSAYHTGPDTVRFAVITVKGEGYNDR